MEKELDVNQLIGQMTLEEKASLMSGSGFWATQGVERLGIPAVMVSDGPHGLRKQDQSADHLGINESIKAVCFPTGVGAASTFDEAFMEEMGRLIGDEAQAEDLAVVLGPAINIKRSPLCGRNFEYYSEDPLVAGKMAAAFIRGVQERGVGTSVKHFAVNNQETRRMTSSSNVSERAMRELYLANFEIAVKEGRPWTVMDSYNRINGEFAGEARWLLQTILRDEWGFDGLVVSDWGAVNDRVAGIEAGMDLEMPSVGKPNDRLIIEAVREGRLSQERLDDACRNMLNLVNRYLAGKRDGAVFDREADHQKAGELASRTMVLLKNDELLPLTKGKKVALIGAFAKNPRFQGGGSSHINTHKVDSAWEIARAYGDWELSYAPGYDIAQDEADPELIREAKRVAEAADVALVFAGLPDRYESEGYDRTHMNLPQAHDALIAAVADVQPNTVVILHNGSPVLMPWIKMVPAVLEAYLAGEGTGRGVIDIVSGRVNPSAHLAETFPLALGHTPAYGNFPGFGDEVNYEEDVFVGYRWYSTRKLPVLFPFGYGLSYTTFSCRDLELSAAEISESDSLTVSVTVSNDGDVAGKALVQVYVRPEAMERPRPLRELKAFTRVDLEPGESRTVELALDRRAFAEWNETIHDWTVAGGIYHIEICSDAETVRLSMPVTVRSESGKKRLVIHANTTLGDLLREPSLQPVLSEMMGQFGEILGQSADSDLESEAISPEMVAAMAGGMPLRALRSFMGMDNEAVNQVIVQLQGVYDEQEIS